LLQSMLLPRHIKSSCSPRIIEHKEQGCDQQNNSSIADQVGNIKKHLSRSDHSEGLILNIRNLTFVNTSD
jgi:hypothetical protein